MNSPIEIKVNQELIQEIILSAIKQSIASMDIKQQDNLKCVNSSNAMKILGVGKIAFENLVDSKILEPIKMGDGFKFPLWALQQFQENYKGMDLTSLERCISAKQKIDLAESIQKN